MSVSTIILISLGISFIMGFLQYYAFHRMIRDRMFPDNTFYRSLHMININYHFVPVSKWMILYFLTLFILLMIMSYLNKYYIGILSIILFIEFLPLLVDTSKRCH